MKEYVDNFAPVINQCSSKNLIPTLLFQDCSFPDCFKLFDQVDEQNIRQIQNNDHIKNFPQLKEATINAGSIQKSTVQPHDEIAIEVLSKELNDMKQQYMFLKEEIEKIQVDLSEVDNIFALKF